MINATFSAQYNIVDRHWCFDVYIISFSLIQFRGSDTDLDVEVASFATDPIISLGAELNIRTIFDACGDFYFQDFLVFVESSSWQNFSVFGEYFPDSSTFSTGDLTLHRAKWCLYLLSYCTVSFTGITCFFRSSGYFL